MERVQDPLPNELAEGVSTFTNGLVIEKRYGAAAYRNYIRYCANAYLNGVIVKVGFAVRDVVFDPDDRLLLRRAQ